jgi:hypothetical protein
MIETKMCHQPKVSHTNQKDTSQAIGTDYNLKAHIDLGEGPCGNPCVNPIWSIEPDFGFTFRVSLILLRVQYSYSSEGHIPFWQSAPVAALRTCQAHVAVLCLLAAARTDRARVRLLRSQTGSGQTLQGSLLQANQGACLRHEGIHAAVKTLTNSASP